MSLGLKIRKARKAKGLTQARLGELVGVSRGVIILYESNKTHPKDTMIEMLEKVLEVNFDTFVFSEETEQAPKFRKSYIDYKEVIRRSIESEEFAMLVAPFFHFIEMIAGEHLSDKDENGIEEFNKLYGLYEKKADLHLKMMDVQDELAALRQKSENET